MAPGVLRKGAPGFAVDRRRGWGHCLGVMNTSHENLKKAFDTVRALERLRGDIDPAAGVKLEIWQGEKGDEDPSRRHFVWLGNGHEVKILDVLLAGERESLAFWIRAVESDIRAAQAQLEVAKKYTPAVIRD